MAPSLTTSQFILVYVRDVFQPQLSSTHAWTMYWKDVGEVRLRSVDRNCPIHWSWLCESRGYIREDNQNHSCKDDQRSHSNVKVLNQSAADIAWSRMKSVCREKCWAHYWSFQLVSFLGHAIILSIPVENALLESTINSRSAIRDWMMTLLGS